MASCLVMWSCISADDAAKVERGGLGWLGVGVALDRDDATMK